MPVDFGSATLRQSLIQCLVALGLYMVYLSLACIFIIIYIHIIYICILHIVYIEIWGTFITTSLLSLTIDDGECKGNHPLLWP